MKNESYLKSTLKNINLISFDEVSKFIQTSPSITIATLSLYRYANLLYTIQHNAQQCVNKPNICLRVQAAEEMDIATKKQVLDILTQFYNFYDLQFTFKNHGSGVPRHDVVHRAVHYLNSDYVITLDDDTTMPPYSIEIMAALLNKDPQLGAVALWVQPRFLGWIIQNKILKKISLNPPLTYVDATGSASLMTKKAVFETCNLDPEYYIGWGDFDFCLQMRNKGWKIGVLAIPGYKATNAGTTDPKYNAIRYNQHHANESLIRFRNKWGIDIQR